MICPNCGKEMPEGSSYCNKCGTKLLTNKNLVKSYRRVNLKKIIIYIVIVFIVALGTFYSYKYIQSNKYNNFIMSGNNEISKGNYENAIKLYNNALSYKDNSYIRKKITLAENYKKYEDIYNTGLKFMDNKKYNDAINKFKIIDTNSEPIYNKAQEKIAECKKQIINQYIKAGNAAIKNGNYTSAYKYADNILEMDPNNSNGKQLKSIVLKQYDKSNQQDEQNNQITIKYSIDENGNILSSNYPNGSSIQLKVGDTINLEGSISPKSSQRILFDGIIMKSTSQNIIKTVSVGGGDINIIPNKYDWDKAYKYNIIVSN